VAVGRFKTFGAVGATLAILVITVAVACVMMWRFHIWFPWLVIGAVQLPVALGWFAWTRLKNLEKSSEEVPIAAIQTQTALTALPAIAPVSVLQEATTLRASPVPEAQERYASTPQVPDHQLIRVVGKGAYGEVWLARDVIGSFHAVKIVYRNRFSVEAPFLREFKGIQKFTPISLSHPGLVHILHVGRNDREGYFYYIMELGDDQFTGRQIEPETYSGRTLAKDIARRGSLPVLECLDLGLALTSALDFLHERRLIHRDIKPSNIIFVETRPKFADVGLVTDIASTGASTYVGTEGFIPPEGPGHPAADIYSLGKVLYEATMGRDRHRYPEFPTSVAERSDHAALLHLNRIILKACAAKVEERFDSAAAIHEELLCAKKKLG